MKTKLILFITSIFTILIPIKPLICIIILITFLDTAIGIYATIKINGRKSVKSHKLFNIVPKIGFYGFAILISFLIDKFVMGGAIYGIPFLLSKSATVIFSIIEFKSIDENSQKLGNKPFLEILKKIILNIKNFKKDLNEIK